MFRGVSIQRGFSGGVSVWGWVSVLGVGLCLRVGLCPGGGILCPGGFSVQGGVCQEDPPYRKERTVRILLECILVDDSFDISLVRVDLTQSSILL